MNGFFRLWDVNRVLFPAAGRMTANVAMSALRNDRVDDIPAVWAEQPSPWAQVR
jgi:hypothetical protein